MIFPDWLSLSANGRLFLLPIHKIINIEQRWMESCDPLTDVFYIIEYICMLNNETMCKSDSNHRKK